MVTPYPSSAPPHSFNSFGSAPSAPGNDERKAVAERIRAIDGVREVQVNSYFGLRVMALPHAIRPITEEDEVRSVVVLGEIRPFMNIAKVG